jgi:glycosyltransferase involved in cell wall biosynthesis
MKEIAATPMVHDLVSNSGCPTRPRRRLHLLFIEDRIPSRRLGAGFGRSEIMIRKLLDVADVDIFACDGATSELAAEDIRRLSTSYGPDPDRLREQLSAEHYDGVYICRPHNLARYGEVLGAWKSRGGKIVYDTEAIFAVREVARLERAESYAAIAASPLFEPLVKDELRPAELVDVIVAVNPSEAEIIRRHRRQPVFTIGHHLPGRLLDPEPMARSGLLFVGALHDTGAPNYDGLVWFLDQVWPRIRAARPDETLRIAGFVGPAVSLEGLRRDGVACLGPLPELTGEYARARAFVAPTRFAAGIPFKVHEALSYGVPTVVSLLINEQLAHPGEFDDPLLAATVNDGGQAFAEACLRLLTDDGLWRRKHAAALRFVARFCPPSLLRDTIDEILQVLATGQSASSRRFERTDRARAIPPLGQTAAVPAARDGGESPEIRIVQVSPTTYSRASVIGGGEKMVLYADYALRLAGHARGLRLATSVLSFGDQTDTAYSDHDVLYQPIPGRPWDPLSIDVDALRTALRRADIVYVDQCLCPVGMFVAAHARLLGCRVIGRDSGAEEYPFVRANPEIGAIFDGFHAQSAFAAASFRDFNAPVQVIPGPVNSHVFVPPSVSERDPEEVLAVGRMMPHKGFDKIIRALPDELKLTVVGQPYDQPYLEFLRHLAIGKRVSFETGIGDATLRSLLQQAGLFVHASSHRDVRGGFHAKPELFGLAPLEALSSGLPAIVSDAGSLPELAGLPGCICFRTEGELADLLVLHAAGSLRRPDEAAMHEAVDSRHGPLSTGEQLLGLMGLV